jgi:metaxin
MLELYAWGPSHGLNSFDPFCLSIETYMNIAEVRWLLNEVNTPLISPSGELPILKVGSEPITGTGNIIKVLKSRVCTQFTKGHDLDHLLSKNELMESQAFIAMVEDNLYDALLYTWYLDEENYAKTTRPTYSKSLSFLSRYTLPAAMQKRVRKRLCSIRKRKDSEGNDVPEIFEHVREYYQVLADKLADKEFFYGTS